MVLVQTQSAGNRYETFVVSGVSSILTNGCNYFNYQIVTPCYHLLAPFST